MENYTVAFSTRLDRSQSSGNRVRPGGAESTFKKVLQEKTAENKINISNHAKARIHKRNIALNDSDLSKLDNALNKVKSKGSRETLVYYNDNAYLFNVNTKTLITAIDKGSMQGNVFTNIDSTVFL